MSYVTAIEIEQMLIEKIDGLVPVAEVVAINARSYPCSHTGCVNKAYAKGLCNAHYIRSRSGTPLNRPIRTKKAKSICSKCIEPVGKGGGWGMCKTHYRTERRRLIRKVCVEALGGRCIKCNGVFPDVAYDFHHRDEKTKIDDPARMIDRKSLGAIAAEIAKCDLLCANCHRIEHYALDI